MKLNCLSLFFVLRFLLITLLFLPACSGEKKPPPPPPVPVLVGTVTEKTVPVELKVIGNVEAYSTVSIKSRLAGQLVQVNFKEGQDVKQGDLLFVIDPRPYEAALKQVEANLERDKALANKAKADAGRYAELIRKQFVSQQDYEQAKATAESLGATVHADEVAVQNARLNLSYCYIKAPITGRTGSLIAHQGNMIKDNADTAMLVINQIQPIYVSFALPEQNLAAVRQYMATGEGAGFGRHRRAGEQPRDGGPQLYRQHRGQSHGDHLVQSHLYQRVQAPVAGVVRQRGGEAFQPAPRRPGALPGHSDEPGRRYRLRGEARPDRGGSPGGSGAAHRTATSSSPRGSSPGNGS